MKMLDEDDDDMKMNDTDDEYDFVPVDKPKKPTKTMENKTTSTTSTTTEDMTPSTTEKKEADDKKEEEDDKKEEEEEKQKAHSVVVSGEAMMEVENASAFVNSEEAKEGVKKAIALKANVESKNVEVTLSLVESEARRLSTGSVKVEFTITLPADSATDASSTAEILQTQLDSISTSELAQAIVTAVAEETGVTYVLEVQAFTATAQAVEVEITTTTTTTMDSSTGDDDEEITTTMDEPPKADDDGSNRQSQVCVLGAALVFWQFFA